MSRKWTQSVRSCFSVMISIIHDIVKLKQFGSSILYCVLFPVFDMRRTEKTDSHHHFHFHFHYYYYFDKLLSIQMRPKMVKWLLDIKYKSTKLLPPILNRHHRDLNDREKGQTFITNNAHHGDFGCWMLSQQ